MTVFQNILTTIWTRNVAILLREFFSGELVVRRLMWMPSVFVWLQRRRMLTTNYLAVSARRSGNDNVVHRPGRPPMWMIDVRFRDFIIVEKSSARLRGNWLYI